MSRINPACRGARVVITENETKDTKKEWLLHFAELFYGLSTRLRPENLNDVARERRANQLESLIVSLEQPTSTVGYKID